VLNEPKIFGHEELNRDQILLDRGFHYGDGLFETMASVKGELPLLDHHLARLERDCIKLLGRFPANEVQQRLDRVYSEISQHRQPMVVKLLITRGVSGRGYGYTSDTPLRVFAFIYPYHPISDEQRLSGIRVIHCLHSLGDRGLLGSIKHCNRLDQIVARGEVQQSGADEGLMYNASGQLIEATSANVAVKFNDQWLTPEISCIGIAGVARQIMIEKGLLTVANITASTLQQSSGMAIFNSVMGILPVANLPDKVFDDIPAEIIRELAGVLPPHMRGQW
jgi:4-amino-4-deoxychorismate lyase